MSSMPTATCGLTVAQAEPIETLQKRSLRIRIIIFPEVNPSTGYREALEATGVETLQVQRKSLSRSVFLKTLNLAHRLKYLIPPPEDVSYGLRRAIEYPLPALRTKQASKILINYGLSHRQT